MGSRSRLYKTLLPFSLPASVSEIDIIIYPVFVSLPSSDGYFLPILSPTWVFLLQTMEEGGTTEFVKEGRVNTSNRDFFKRRKESSVTPYEFVMEVRVSASIGE